MDERTLPKKPTEQLGQVEALLGRCLELPAEQQEAALEDLAKEHPKLAQIMREAYAAVRKAGLVGDGDPGECGGSGAPDDTAGDSATRVRIEGLQILERLGSGGMGEVFLADQLEPVRRKVAVKLVRRAMRSERILARFESERQALARMSHPCIAQVFGAGTTDDGAPYFLMEYVPGTPIQKYCDQNKLTIEDRLELFVKVCEGVQHAHQKGIIHRDIKPSNILVVEIEGNPLVKIIDFGIAKATEEKLSSETFVTEAGAVVGTPEYMSPEQAGEDPGDLDTRTDVYSLGVVLYELLVGALPFDALELRRLALHQIVQVLQETLPPKPSTKLQTLLEISSDPASKRRATPTSLSRKIRGDLDRITMKAMEKDRERRYVSAADLAADIERYRNNEPVLAGPPSSSYMLKKQEVHPTQPVTTTPWSAGAKIEDLEGVANILDRTARAAVAMWPGEPAPFRDGSVIHAPVGTFRANGFGMHDMHGNVWEWCKDRHGDYSLPLAPGNGDRHVPGGRLSDRVNRGGCYSHVAREARCSYRYYNTPTIQGNSLGLRYARVVYP